jgi:hypothetical protein
LFFCKGFLSLSPLCRVWSSLIGTCSAAVSTNHQHLKSYKLTQLSIKKVSLTFTIRHPTGKTEQQDLFLNFPCGLWNVVVSCRGEFFLRILPHVRCSSIFWSTEYSTWWTFTHVVGFNRTLWLGKWKFFLGFQA